MCVGPGQNHDVEGFATFGLKPVVLRRVLNGQRLHRDGITVTCAMTYLMSIFCASGTCSARS